MTVIEAVCNVFSLGDYEKTYTDTNGNSVDMKYPLDKLGKMDVKEIRINLVEEKATITIIEGSPS